MNQLVNTMITIAASGLSALFAAWAGARLGLRKFRQERSFDARLDWHRKLAETAKVLRNRSRAVRAFKQGGTPPEIALPIVKELGELAFQFQELAEVASLYATKGTHAAIRDVLAEMTKQGQVFAKYASDSTAVTAEQAQQYYSTSLSGFERVYDLLARDLRKMLRLGKLKEHEGLDRRDWCAMSPGGDSDKHKVHKSANESPASQQNGPERDHSPELESSAVSRPSNRRQDVVSQVHKTITDTPFPLPVVEAPEDVVIWRYLSMGRFIALLAQRAFYFARAEAFEDQFEAAIGPQERREEWLEGFRRMFSEVLEEARAAGKLDAGAPIEEETKRLLNDWIHLNKVIQLNTYLLSWHEGENESEAMWRLYSRDMSEGVAIRSTCGRLREAIAGLQNLRIARVSYRDYDAGPAHPMSRFFNKRLEFEHEKEIRAVFISLGEEPGSEPGKLIPVDVAKLVEEIVVSPYAPGWFESMIQSLVKRLELTVPVRRSSLRAEAFRY